METHMKHLVTFPIKNIIDPASIPESDPVRRNLRVLLAIAKAADVERFNLADFAYGGVDEKHTEDGRPTGEFEPACGTMFCLAGTAALYDYFQQQGIYIEASSGRHRGGRFALFEANYGMDATLNRIFGGTDHDNAPFSMRDLAFDRLFSTYGEGRYDAELIAYHGLPLQGHETNADHKALAIARIEHELDRTFGG
jgi:hypothetical protein